MSIRAPFQKLMVFRFDVVFEFPCHKAQLFAFGNVFAVRTPSSLETGVHVLDGLQQKCEAVLRSVSVLDGDADQNAQEHQTGAEENLPHRYFCFNWLMTAIPRPIRSSLSMLTATGAVTPSLEVTRKAHDRF